MSSHEFVHKLANPVIWLTGVVRNFGAYGFDPETCTIRRGITGIGLFPNYKLEGPSHQFVLCVGSVVRELTATPGRTFNGRHHSEMSELDELERRDEHWSPVMTFYDLKELLSEISSGGVQ